MTDTPDLTGARRYRETADRPIAGGTWHVLPDRTVVYEAPDGAVRPSMVLAADLEGSPESWVEIVG